MNLSWNKIEFIPEGVFNIMSTLTQIDLSHNMLIHLPSDSSFSNTHTNENIIGYLPWQLNVFDLSNNHLIYISASSFSQRSLLSVLDLGSNRIMQVEEMSFYNLTELVALDLSHNHIETLTLGDVHLDIELVEQQRAIDSSQSIFGGLFNLRTLNISHNNVTYLSHNPFCDLTGLELLNLGWNHIHFLSHNIFNGLGSLTSLIIRGNHIQMIESDIFLPLRQVNSIGLEGNCLSDLCDNLFDGNPNLILLQLHNNNFITVPWVVSNKISACLYFHTIGIMCNVFTHTLCIDGAWFFTSWDLLSILLFNDVKSWLASWRILLCVGSWLSFCDCTNSCAEKNLMVFIFKTTKIQLISFSPYKSFWKSQLSIPQD